MTGQHRGRTGGQLQAAGLTGRAAGGQEDNMVGHFPQILVTGGVKGPGSCLIRCGGNHGGGAAAVQTEGGYTAQLLHPLRQRPQGRAHAVAGLPPVNGVQHQVAVGLHTHGGAGSGGDLEAALHHAA